MEFEFVSGKAAGMRVTFMVRVPSACTAGSSNCAVYTYPHNLQLPTSYSQLLISFLSTQCSCGEEYCKATGLPQDTQIRWRWIGKRDAALPYLWFFRSLGGMEKKFGKITHTPSNLHRKTQCMGVRGDMG
jgi:hypothetical protein